MSVKLIFLLIALASISNNGEAQGLKLPRTVESFVMINCNNCHSHRIPQESEKEYSIKAFNVSAPESLAKYLTPGNSSLLTMKETIDEHKTKDKQHLDPSLSDSDFSVLYDWLAQKVKPTREKPPDTTTLIIKGINKSVFGEGVSYMQLFCNPTASSLLIFQILSADGRTILYDKQLSKKYPDSHKVTNKVDSFASWYVYIQDDWPKTFSVKLSITNYLQKISNPIFYAFDLNHDELQREVLTAPRPTLTPNPFSLPPNDVLHVGYTTSRPSDLEFSLYGNLKTAKKLIADTLIDQCIERKVLGPITNKFYLKTKKNLVSGIISAVIKVSQSSGWYIICDSFDFVKK